MEEYVNIGITQKTHGTSGEIKVNVEEAFLEDFVKASVIFLSINGKAVPYFLEDIRGYDPLIIKLEEVDSKETAKTIVNKTLFLRASDVSSKSASKDLEDYGQYIGYQAIEKERGPIGPIVDIVEMPQQILALVSYRNKEIYIPINETFLQEISEEKRTILFELPEGLLDL